MAREVINPFSLTKANDLTNDQIQDLWVDVGAPESPESLFNAGRFASPMPTFILGGKGSGKTHLMRYASYPLQKIRFDIADISLCDGLRQDGYAGIYMRCSGIENGRFHGKGQTSEAWLEVFSYYLELTLGSALLRIVTDILPSDRPAVEGQLCSGAHALFDRKPPDAMTVDGLLEDLETRRRTLDYQVNNAAFTGNLQPDISLSRGRMTFGLPKLLSGIDEFSGILFAYQLDEFENLTLDQQQHVNTLVREREGAATLKIGARQFGVRTHQTLSAGEENIRDSEFDELRLDQRFRQNEKSYKELATKLVARRLESFWPGTTTGQSASRRKLGEWFDEPDSGWSSPSFLAMIKSRPSALRPHILRLSERLLTCSKAGDVPGVGTPDECRSILVNVQQEDFPLLEKLNTVLIYNAWANGKDVLSEAALIQAECSEFILTGADGRYKQKLNHYKTDLIAQLVRASPDRQVYAGLTTFTRMSEGQPRALITLLKQTFDWASFQGEAPFSAGRISLDAQSKGALAASEWFHNSMRTTGAEGRSILIAIDRLAQLFRINRYADNPIECSLIGFSVGFAATSDAAAQTLKLAVDRSFLVEVLGGQQDRNSEQVTHKYQLNRMLVPRWGLPTGRRGIKPFTKFEIDAVFDPSKESEFAELVSDWTARMTAPFSRQGHASKSSAARADTQSDLFT